MHVIYPGSFDPLTFGHLSIIERASTAFQKITVFVALNPNKKGWLSVDERLHILRESLKSYKNVKIDTGEGLLVEHVKRLGGDIILKGVRSVYDLQQEQMMAEANYEIGSEIETLVFLSRFQFQGISSSLVRQIFALGGEIDAFVPKGVSQFLKSKK